MTLPNPHPTLGSCLHSGSREIPGASGTRRFLSTALLVCGVLGGLGGLGLAALLLLFAVFGDPPDMAVAIFMAVFMAMASGVGGTIAGGLGWWWRSKLAKLAPTTAAISIYDDGVAFSHGEDGEDSELTTLAWDDIEGFFCPPSQSPIYGVKVNVPYSFFVVEGGGKSFTARNMSDLKKMGKAIESQVTPRRIQAALALLQKGKPVSFGSIILSTEGIRGFSIGSIKWADFRGMGIGRMNRLTARERGVPVGLKGPFFVETPNVTALFDIVHRMSG